MLSIAAGASYKMSADNALHLKGNGQIDNAGVFEKTTGTGLSDVSPDIVNTGSIILSTGTLDFLGGLANRPNHH